MKTKNIQSLGCVLFFAFLIPLVLFSCSSSKKIVQLNADDVRNMVDSSQFVFVAERVTPLPGTDRSFKRRYSIYFYQLFLQGRF
jgi:hypothetical protein